MESTWVQTAKNTSSYPSLKGEVKADVAVIGSGLTGITLAYLLAKAGKSAVLITRKTAAESASAYTTGFITCETDTSLTSLAKMFGQEKAKTVWEAGQNAIDLIEETIRSENIECEFVRCPSYTYAKNDGEWNSLRDEARLARELGFEVHAREGSEMPFENRGVMEIANQAKFHSLKYGYALKKRAHELGAQIFDHTEAHSIEREGADLRIKTNGGSILAKDVAITTYYPFTEPRQLFAHTGEYTTYMIEYKYQGSLPEAIYQDMHNPYHYFRADTLKSRIIVGGEDHRVEIKMGPEKNFRALQEYVRQTLTKISLREVRRWKGGIIEPLDGLPFIGSLKSDEHQYVATGFSGFGMTMSRVAAEAIADDIIGKKNQYIDIFSPARVPNPYQLAKKGVDYVAEFFGGAIKNAFK